MATLRTYQDMLNEYLPNELLADELLKRDWLLQNCQKDNNWLGGDSIVPFRGQMGSSVKFGGLTAETNISQHKYVRGKMAGYKEVWGSMIFNETDLMQHGKISEQNFLKILPDQTDEFIDYMKMCISLNIMGGPHFAVVTDATNAATGIMVVDKIDRFEIDQLVILMDGNSVAAQYYVTAINVNDKSVTLSATRGGVAANVSAYSVAQAAKFFYDGVVAVGGSATAGTEFNSLKLALLSAANGGSANLHGQSKLAYPYLQAVNVSGSTISATNILDKLFDAWSEIKIRAKSANPSKCVMSYKHLGTIMKLIEQDKSPFKVTVGSSVVSKYNWTEVNITGVRGGFNLVGLQEMDDDVIFFLDLSSFTFRSNGFVQKKKSPEGLEYYRIRGTDGFKLITDACLFGDMEFTMPAKNAVIHSIPNY